MIVAALLPAFGWAALPRVIIATSALMTLVALARRVAVGAHGQAATPMVEVPATLGRDHRTRRRTAGRGDGGGRGSRLTTCQASAARIASWTSRPLE
ncbi:MAG: hypothetical protein EA355_06405 [Rhodobacteraceae bacterium]|nr:MAG: hypothetical protein EA355_06405 [Paracoccaceae bacterium]